MPLLYINHHIYMMPREIMLTARKKQKKKTLNGTNDTVNMKKKNI